MTGRYGGTFAVASCQLPVTSYQLPGISITAVSVSVAAAVAKPTTVPPSTSWTHAPPLAWSLHILIDFD